jgi:hypothetical protein
MATAEQIIMNWVAPAVGTTFSTLLTLGPMSAVLDMRKKEKIGDVNPDPFPILFANGVAW